ncbi:MAG: DUF4364 family protein [Lachnospiraceae bacterium]|nr:DUF4364 family protein [Lachnospiraceae bacterium]
MAVDSATLYKLIILYMLNKVNFPLTNTQISDFFLENDYTNYFSLQQSINDLDSKGFIFSDTIRNASYYHLTSEGRQTIEYFENKIPNRIIDDIDVFLMRNKYELRNEVGTLSDYYRSSNGEYIVHCQVKESNTILIELNLSVPTKEAASFMCSRWKDASAEIYKYTINNLMKSKAEIDDKNEEQSQEQKEEIREEIQSVDSGVRAADENEDISRSEIISEKNSATE